MRRPLLTKNPPGSRTRVSIPESKPAPVGGLNKRDSIADMDEQDAVIMDNWFPLTNDVMVRKGIDDHVTGISSQVESLMPYVTPAGTEKLFAAENDSFYDVTSAGAVGAAVVSSLSNARWSSVNFTNSSGTSYLCCFNGADSPRYYDNSSWITITGVSSPAITGVTTSNLKAPWVHKRRLWTVEEGTLKAWYLPVDAVGGAANALDLSGICQLGGSLVAGATWSLDSGDGPDDYWAVITTEGEVIVYAGTDPSSSSTWSLVGVWRIGEPIGARPLYKYRGDLLVICRDGVFPLSKALITSRTDRTYAFTDKIRNDIAELSALYNSKFGWQVIFYPEANMLLLNVPINEGSSQIQYAMNTITGSWGKFKGVEANCWAIFNGQPYYGGNGVVGKFWGSFADNSNNIDSDILPAFSYFSSRGRLKEWKLVKPVLLSDGSPTTFVGLNVDYQQSDPTGLLAFTPNTYATWDNGVWDTATWGGTSNITQDWNTVHGVGTNAALRMKTASAGIELKLEAIDYIYENGGIVG